MHKHSRVFAGVLGAALVAGSISPAFAADYNDGSVIGNQADWNAWVEEWKTVATDYTKVSLTPGADETQLNFAWYSKDESGKQATPVVHFGTDKNALTAYTGKASRSRHQPHGRRRLPHQSGNPSPASRKTPLLLHR